MTTEIMIITMTTGTMIIPSDHWNNNLFTMTHSFDDL